MGLASYQEDILLRAAESGFDAGAVRPASAPAPESQIPENDVAAHATRQRTKTIHIPPGEGAGLRLLHLIGVAKPIAYLRTLGPIGRNPSHGRTTRRRNTSCRARWTRSIGTRNCCGGDLATAVQQLKREPGKGLFTGGVMLPRALAELRLIDEYEFIVHPRQAGHGPTLFAGLSKHVELKLVGRREFGSGAVAMRYESCDRDGDDERQ